MASTPAQNIDTWLRAPYTDAGYLSYTQNQDGTESQQHPGNGVVLDAANTVERFSVAKTQRSYDVDGVNAINGSTVFFSDSQICVKHMRLRITTVLSLAHVVKIDRNFNLPKVIRGGLRLSLFLYFLIENDYQWRLKLLMN